VVFADPSAIPVTNYLGKKVKMTTGKITDAIFAPIDGIQLSAPTCFEACDVDGHFLARYDEERPMMPVVEGILNKNAAQLKTAMQAVATQTGVSVMDLATDIRTAARAFRSLSEVFECAAARIEAVEAELLEYAE
jgi:hypothetical protein